MCAVSSVVIVTGKRESSVPKRRALEEWKESLSKDEFVSKRYPVVSIGGEFLGTVMYGIKFKVVS